MSRLLIFFSTTNGIESALIRKVTECDFSHVGFIVDDDWWRVLGIPKQDGQWTFGAHLDGIKLRKIEEEHATKMEVCAVNCTQEQKDALIAHAKEWNGRPYDKLDIVGIALRQNWSEHGHAICSELVTRLCLLVSIILLRVAPSGIPSITPRDVYMSPLLRLA